jgi:23S rRNA (pseudouridine1915-N3)-methyltransferase
MRLRVIAVGTRMPGWVDEAFNEYARRMPRHLALELTELRPESRTSGKTAVALCEAEGERIEAALPEDCLRVVLDERGREMRTEDLARWLEARTGEGRDIAFVIGGADGLSPGVKQSAHLMLRLSAMTLPHGLARVLLAEQLYRATSILQNHPYHRA